MSDLEREHPHEYPKGTPPLGGEEIRALAEQVSSWEVRESTLVRSFTFKDFSEAMAYVLRVALLAETEGHHPDISISWNRVELTFWTHTAEGLTRNDFIMAAKVDRLLS